MSEQPEPAILPPLADHRCYKPEQMAEKLQIPESSVYRYARTGVIPEHIIFRVGKHLRFLAKLSDEWIATGGSGLPDNSADIPGTRPSAQPASRGRRSGVQKAG